MMSKSDKLQKKDAPVPELQLGKRGVQLKTLEDLYRFSVSVHASKLAPQGLDTPEKIMVAAQLGAELGLSFMQAVSSIHVINGKPGLSGEATLALIRASAACEWIRISYGKDDAGVFGIVESMRKGAPGPETTRFTQADAKQAGLWGGKDVWRKYPGPMCQWRALAVHARQNYSDVTLGIGVREELDDYGPRVLRDVTPRADTAAADPLAPALAPGAAEEHVEAEAGEWEEGGVVIGEKLESGGTKSVDEATGELFGEKSERF